MAARAKQRAAYGLLALAVNVASQGAETVSLYDDSWHVSPLPFPGTAEAPLRTKSATRLLRARAGHVYLGVGSISDSLSHVGARN